MIKTGRRTLLTITAMASCIALSFAQERINITGTRVMIVPPPGFTVATGFTGLAHDSAAIHVFDLDGGNFDENAATFSKEKFQQKGLKILEYKQTTVNGYKAKYALAEGKGMAKNHMLVLGDSTFSVMLTGVVACKDPKLSEAVKKSIFSATYKKTMKVDHMASTFFTVGDSKSRFRFAHAAAGLFAFTPGGTLEGKEDDPVVLAMPLPATAEMTPESLAVAMVGGLTQKGIVVKETRNKWTGTVNGYAAYEAELYCESGDRKVLAYELAVINGDKAVVIICMAHHSYETTLKEFKELAKSVKFK